MDTLRALGITVGAVVGFAIMLGIIVCGEAITILYLQRGVTPALVQQEVQSLRNDIEAKAAALMTEIQHTKEWREETTKTWALTLARLERIERACGAAATP